MPDIRVTLRPLAADVPVDVRLASLLKTALRRDRLRCIRVEALPPDPPKARERAADGGQTG
jgi:hypothetical protein